MIWLVLAVLVAWVAFGPWVLAAVVIALCVPRLRWWCQDRFWIDRRRGSVAIAALTIVSGLVVLVPDAWLPVPQSPGLVVTPSYVGRPVAARPVQAGGIPQNPHLARNGVSSRRNDAAATGAYTWPGPAGHEPEVDTAWFGVESCATVAIDTHDRLITLCRDPDGPALHVLDPDSMRKLATKELPERAESDDGPGSSACDGTPFYLDAVDRAVVATADRRIVAVGTADADGEPDLTTDQTWDLTAAVPKDDCLVALLPDWTGRIWFETHGGLVGTLAPATGAVRTLPLDEEITDSLATDETGGAYVGTTRALYRLSAGPGGAPAVDWRAEFHVGSQEEQSGRRIGTTPTIMDGGIVAITDNAGTHTSVVFYERSTGREICRRPVFEADASATHNPLVAVGDGVIMENNHGDGGPVSTLLGAASSPGLARVDVAGGACRLVWSNDEIAPSGMAKVSLASGLVYVYTKRPNWWGVSAWYLTAIDVTTGRTVFGVRTGTGILMNNHHGALAIAPDGAAWIATLAGMVRVRDRVRD